MSIASRLLGCGVAPLAATNIVGDNANSLTATGTAITDAFQIAAVVNHFGTVASSTGAKAPADMNPGDSIIVHNRGAQTLALYPPTALGVVNAGTAGAAISVAANKGALMVMTKINEFMVILVA